MSCGCGAGINISGGGINVVSNKVKVDAADLVADFLANKLVAGANISFNILNVGGNEQIEISSTGGVSGLTAVLDSFTAVADQTSFTLSSTPLLPGAAELWVNGEAYINGVDFSVALNVATWLNTDFNLENGDVIIVTYKKSGGSDLQPVLDQFSPAAAQTIFNLSQLPLFVGTVMMFVNGQAFLNGVDFGVVGQVATWNDIDFAMDGTEAVMFTYDMVGGSILTGRQDVFAAGAAQTAFTLSHIPSDSSTVVMYVNGLAYENGIDYTVVANNVTWLDVDFVMVAGYKILFVYDF